MSSCSYNGCLEKENATTRRVGILYTTIVGKDYKQVVFLLFLLKMYFYKSTVSSFLLV
jgi:hypothetical protein